MMNDLHGGCMRKQVVVPAYSEKEDDESGTVLPRPVDTRYGMFVISSVIMYVAILRTKCHCLRNA